MLKTLIIKPLPWIALGSVFFVGYQATLWREAFFGLRIYQTTSESRETILQGFTAVYGFIFTPLALLLGGVSVLLPIIDNYKFNLAEVQRSLGRRFRACKSTCKSNYTFKQSVDLGRAAFRCWFALRKNPPIVRNRFRFDLSGLWVSTRPSLIWFTSIAAGAKSIILIAETTQILQRAIDGGMKKAIHDRAFSQLILHGYPPSFLWSVMWILLAVLFATACYQWSDSRLKDFLLLAPGYIISVWMFSLAPQLAGFELARRPCPKVRFIACPPVFQGGARWMLPAEMLKDTNRCYLLSERQGSEALLIVGSAKGGIDSKLPAVFVVPSGSIPPFEIESSEDVWRVLVSIRP